MEKSIIHWQAMHENVYRDLKYGVCICILYVCMYLRMTTTCYVRIFGRRVIDLCARPLKNYGGV